MQKIISILLSLLTVFASTTLIAYAGNTNNDIQKKTYTVSYADYDSFSFDDEILINGEKHTLKSVKVIDENTITFKVITDQLPNKDYTAPNSTENPDNPNQKGKLLNTETTENVQSGRTRYVTKAVDYTALPISDTIPSTFNTEYYDEESDQIIDAELKLTDTKKSNSYWINCDGLKGTVSGYDALYYSLKNSDIQIPKNEKQPTYAGYESSILKSLNLNDTAYRITGSSWSGEPYYNAEGILCRNCIYDAQMKVYDATVSYAANIDLPDIITYTAVSEYEDEIASQYTIEAEYEKAQAEISPTVIVIGAVIGLLVLAALIAVILLYLSKKKKAEENI